MGYVDVRRRRRSSTATPYTGLPLLVLTNPSLHIVLGLFIAVPYSAEIGPAVLFNGYPLGYAILWLLPALAGYVLTAVGLGRLLHNSYVPPAPVVGGEKQLLLALRDLGSLTPVEAALETSLSVDEAEETLTRLAERGHLRLESRDDTLVYVLPSRPHRPR